jgi:hypothetical protein
MTPDGRQWPLLILLAAVPDRPCVCAGHSAGPAGIARMAISPTFRPGRFPKK